MQTESKEKNIQFVNIRLAIVSACHSSSLGRILNQMGIPSVIAINSAEQVSESAAKEFNYNFLSSLASGTSI